MTQATTASSDSRPSQHCDVLVVGGGPAGATIATLLARQGRDVVVLEKAHHPRFHIGESLLPANVPLLEQLGVRAQVEAIGMPKWGVEFCSPQHRHRSYLEFGDAWDKSMPMAWQVRRSAFDDILFRNAGAAGARMLEGVRVRHVDFDADGASIDAVLDDGATQRWRAKFVVDASGRDTLLANQNDWKQKNRKHNSAALFGHFRGARRLEGRKEGHISIFWFAHGWFWFIPLADGSTSIGAVCWPEYLKTRDKPLKEFFADTIAMSPPLAERLAGATLVDDQVWATGNYAYTSERSHGERFLLLGDAYAFIDPVFSSGVYLAMVSAFEGAAVVAKALDEPAAYPAACRRFDKLMRHGPREFSWFIHRMTNPAIRDLFMHPANPLRMQEAVLSLLAGDIYGRSPIWASLWAFKGLYWITSLLTLPRSLRAWRNRRRLIQDMGAVKGENVVAPAP
ncbi:MAG: NAD(P)/FAD-dependent oxidoreductase [Rubrivivax sp.]